MEKQAYYEKHLSAAKHQKDLGIRSPSAGVYGHDYAYDCILELGHSPYTEDNFDDFLSRAAAAGLIPQDSDDKEAQP